MFKSILFLTVTLVITPLMAMQEGDNYGEKQEQEASRNRLPKELWAKILNEDMDVKDNANAGLVSKDFHEAANDDFH